MQDTTPDWFRHHELEDEKRFGDIDKAIADLPRKEDIEKIIHDVAKKYLLNTGGKLKTSVIVTATIIGSFLVIFGGLKTLLGWLGFTYMR